MHVVPITRSTDMVAWTATWNRLAGDNPFLRWEWLGTWWDHYARRSKKSLLVLAVQNKAGQVVGFAPWYFDPASRSIQFLGSGKVCTDYLTVLCEPDHRTAIVQSIADWLYTTPPGQQGCPARDQPVLVGGMASGRCLSELRDMCASRGMPVHEQPGQDIYCSDLPSTWHDYLKLLSASVRRQARNAIAALQNNAQFSLRILRAPEEIERVWALVVDIHQRRRHSVGDTGCFDSPPFGAFLLDASKRLASDGRVEVCLLEHAGRPIAFLYLVVGGQTMYAYQSGIDPDYLGMSPGRVLILACVHQAIDRGFAEFDFMRGDEDYKRRWLGTRRSSVELRVIAPRAKARIRHQVWLTGHTLKKWVKAAPHRLA